MIRVKLIAILLVLIANLTMTAQDKNLWDSLEYYQNNGKPRSALRIAEDLYMNSLKEGKADYVYKCLFTKLQFVSSIGDVEFQQIVEDVQDIAKSAEAPLKQLLFSAIAEMYWMYYSNNSWRISQRTTIEGAAEGKLDTWSAQSIVAESVKYFWMSLDNADVLKQFPKNDYKSIINGHYYDKSETVYEFLAWRAFSFFKDHSVSIESPKDQFVLNEPALFRDNGSFMSASKNVTDTLSFHYNAIKILQELTAFAINKGSSEGTARVEINRIVFVYENYAGSDKDVLYEQALRKALTEYQSNESQARASYYVADLLYTQGGHYTENYPGLKQNFKQASDLCSSVVSKFPDTWGASQCEHLYDLLNRSELKIQAEQTIAEGKTFAVNVSYKNVKTLFFRLAEITAHEIDAIRRRYYNSEEEAFEIYNKAKTVKQGSFELPRQTDLREHSVDRLFDGLPLGHYVLFVDNQPLFDKSRFRFVDIHVSDILQLEKSSGGQFELFYYSRATDKPLEGVVVKYSMWNQVLRKYVTKQKQSDADGRVLFSEEDVASANVVEVCKGSDCMFKGGHTYIRPSYNFNDRQSGKIAIFTDRAIYRPGQRVHFKCIQWDGNGNAAHVAENQSVWVTVRDANYQEVFDKHYQTNKYGTVSGSFDIPQANLNGVYTIEVSGHANTSKTIRVEDYKRPQFEVLFDEFSGNYRLGDTICLKGAAKSYAGAALSNAEAHFKIERQGVGRFWFIPPKTQLIEQGRVQLSDDGRFEVKFVAKPDPLTQEHKDRRFSFSVRVDVTDINGETQGKSTAVTIGDRSLMATINFPDEVFPEVKLKCPLTVVNMNNQAAEASGDVIVYKMLVPQEALRARLWECPDTALYSKPEWQRLFAGNVFTNENSEYVIADKIAGYRFNTRVARSVMLEGAEKWEPGVYRVVLTTSDAFGKKVDAEHEFVLLDPKLKKIAKPGIISFGEINSVYQPGEEVKIVLSSATDIWLRMEVEKKGKTVRSEKVYLSNEIKTIKIPVTEDDRGDFSVHFAAVENSRIYFKEYSVVVPFENKKLQLSFETFRSSLQPGEGDRWRIKIAGPEKENVAAEMLACLYDQSLDKFVKHDWSFSPHSSYYVINRWAGNVALSREFTNVYLYNYYHRAYPRFGDLEWFGFSYRHRPAYRNGVYDDAEVFEEADMEAPVEMMMRESKPVKKMAAPRFKAMASDAFGGSVDKAESGPEEDVAESDAESSADAFGGMQMRSNFNETALFSPLLETDENGDIIVDLTMPDALTRWKMFGVAHTADMKYGTIENELLTQKELMVQPNLPRFLREGDRITISAKISNLVDKELSGQASIECFDALSMRALPLMLQSNKEQPFVVPASQSVAVSWTLHVPETVQAVVFRIKASAGGFTDGEEQSLPVLSNRMLVTESMPLPMSHKGTRKFVFESLKTNSSKTLKHHQYTFEFCSNPAWYAVQALPYMIEYPYECAEQTFSRYYANSIAEHIVNSNDAIKRVFEKWQNAESKQAFVSNLEKNPELKNILLEETPWLRDAQDEAERKKRVANLFDIHQMAANKLSAINQLAELQLSNGAWPWFSGGHASQYITQHIVCGLGKMERMGVAVDGVLKDKLNRSLNYLCGQLRKDYDWMLKNVSEENREKEKPSYNQVHFLYMLSFYPDYKPSKRDNEAVEFYIKQSQKYWLSYNYYLQAMMSVTASRRGDRDLEQKITESLRERASRSEEMGMYFKQEYGWYWYQMPVESQAMVIEAFAEKGDTESVNELKIWLLKQKQTQDWKTTKATTEAVYALLMQGSQWLSSSEFARVEIGGENLTDELYKSGDAEAGTGYVKKRWDGTQIKQGMADIKVTNPNDHPAWGAVYWQYFEQLDKIKAHKTPLQLDKKLFLESETDNGTRITPVDENSKLKVGDLIVVRIELRVDRDMEFVHMKDMRASGLEPVSVLSRYRWQDGLGYYESTRDAATNFFFDYLQTGTYVFEYKLRVSQAGYFSNGITTIQSMYAPEFSSHSEGLRLQVD